MVQLHVANRFVYSLQKALFRLVLVSSSKMSCDYANGLSDYNDKGVLGVPEVKKPENNGKKKNSQNSLIPQFFQVFDDEKTINEKCALLAQMILASKHVVVHTGAGISTSAGIPDFRYDIRINLFYSKTS